MSLTKVSYSMISGAIANVLDFGADPTGVADSTAAINAALVAADVVYLPAGNYKVSQIVFTGSGNTAIFGKTLVGSGLGPVNIIGYVAGTSVIRFGTAGGWDDETNLEEFRADYCNLENVTITATAAYTYGIECQWLTNASWKNVVVSSGGNIALGLYLDFSWDNDFVHTVIAAESGVQMGVHGPNRNAFHGLRVAGGGTLTGIGFDFGGSANSVFGLDASGYYAGVASSVGGFGLTIHGGYFESNDYDINLNNTSGISVTGCRFIVGVNNNIAITQAGSANVRGFLIAGNGFTNKASCIRPTANTQEWVAHGNEFVSCTATIDPVGTGGNYHVFENFEFQFVPVFTNLVTTGSPIFSGKYIRMGKTIRFVVLIDDNGGTTSSTAGSTYFTGLPTGVASAGTLAAVDGGINDLGNGQVSTIYAFTPSWSANGNTITISGSYTVA